MDREIPQNIIRARRFRKIIITSAILFAVLAAFWLGSRLLHNKIKRSRIRTAVVEIGPVESTVSAAGRIVPAFEQVMTSPVSSTIESVFVEVGDSVVPESYLMTIARDELLLTKNRIASELELQRTKKRQLELEIERQQIDLNTSLDIKKLELQYAEAQHELNTKLLEVGGSTERDLRRTALEVQIAQRELDQLRAQQANQELSLQTDLKAVDLQINIEQSKLSEVNRQLELSRVRSNGPAIVTWIDDDIGASVTQGQPLVRLADLSRFRIDGTISDVHGGKLAVGGSVHIRIGSDILDGRIEAVKPSVEQGVITFIVDLDQPSHHLLRPNMRVDIQVVTGGVEDVKRVPNGDFYAGIRDQVVFVVESGKAISHTVDIGASNLDWVQVSGDIVPGDTMIISDMRDYRNSGSIILTDD
ncbi:MAG: efflux RND transporter periplasmic adaptor subunit [Candidatus Zixiibacteriota bacterium]